ncbi:hypothetical protein E8E12_004899 [Didymella heteroderae]|uniref:Uncharacterized protein n=1 Tax=Didymella heteroderae TaxID=1769908 RepID=A0A9P4WJF5_9PLEO|nr:hypothetical protein E8E12_004899 [Didymella heteroderae]
MVVEMPTLATSQARTSAGVLGFTGATSAQPDFGMISAIYDGFRNDTSWYLGERAVNSVCETGNCTWPDFTSAAICSACNDLSDSVKVNRGYGVGGGSIPAPSNVKLSTNYTAFTLQYVNLSNPDTKLYEAAKGGVKNGMEATLLTANRTFDASKTVSFHDLKTMLISIIVLRASEDWMLGKVMWNNSKPIATECALYLCANKYSANTQNGKLNETLLKSWAERDEESYQASTNSSIFEPGPEADAWVASKGSMLYDPLVPRSDLRMSIPVDEDIDTNPRTFNVSYAFITTMSEFLKEITNGTWNINQMAYPPWSSGMTPLVNALWESQNLTETFDHVARSLTYQVRTSSNNASNIIELQGKTQKYSIHVCVRWVYLAFPIAMIALGVIYVVLTIIESTRLHVPVWKESALPGLLHGLDNDTQSLLRGTQSQVIRNRPGDMTVRFGYDEKDETYRLLPEEKNRQHM